MNIKISAQKRDKTTMKSQLTEIRKKGLIPAIIYGEGKPGKLISIEKVPFLKAYRKTIGETAVFEIKVGNKKYSTFIKEMQVHPVTREFLHIDFMEFHKGREVTLEVPIVYIGEEEAGKKGGLVDILIRKLEVSCLPKDIPEHLEVDISGMNIGDTIYVSDLEHPNLKISIPEDTPLVTLLAPKSAKDLASELGETEEEEPTEEKEEEQSTEEK
ncbi:MAG: hypothetical protein B6D62_01940 [Candidatus Cloacimonas sp. 4484_275]|nr:MAG: hypothetical protein B6D62_01940 [Candidatus Cloacimonas sp. 4484_275]